MQSVSAVLNEENYSVATHAHEARNPVEAKGDLERSGQRWSLTNATIREIPLGDTEDDIETES